jgi:hypothetical protein
MNTMTSTHVSAHQRGHSFKDVNLSYMTHKDIEKRIHKELQEVNEETAYETAANNIDKDLKGFNIVMEGELAYYISRQKPKGQVKKDLIEFYSKKYGTTQSQLTKLVNAHIKKPMFQQRRVEQSEAPIPENYHPSDDFTNEQGED